MPPYEKMYYHLFNAITDALRALDANNVPQAVETLTVAQQRGEEMFMAVTGKE